VNLHFLQELTNERDELQTKVTTLENNIAVRDQQLQECQQKIEELSWNHQLAVNEGNSLRQQMESFNKLALLHVQIFVGFIFCFAYKLLLVEI